VNRDAVRARLFANHRRGHEARFRRMPRLTYGGDVIDVDVKSCSHSEGPGMISRWSRVVQIEIFSPGARAEGTHL
jgi:hypothetical protein